MRALLVALGALLLARCDRVPLTWAAVQLMRSLWPAPLPRRAADAEAWCWRAWADAAARAPVPAPPPHVREFSPAEFAALDRPPFDTPWVVRGMLNGSRLSWNAAWLSESPGRGDQMIDYFSDARRALLVPDARGALRDVLASISAGGPQKIGSEMIFRAEPAAVDELAGHALTAKLGARYFSRAMLGTVLTMPVFAARGLPGETTRTDLHCEPIANAVLQLEGSKAWTLLSPEHSGLVRPQVSPDGRAYFHARLGHAAPELAALPVQRVVTHPGDVIFVPTWTWHRVDYVASVMSVTVSLFHFRPVDFARNHPLYAALIVPNLVKEALGLKKQ